MQTRTMTYTNVDIRRVAECFAADLAMLANRTAAKTQEWAREAAHDITLMAVHRCLDRVHIQLRNAPGRLVAVHEYKVRGDTGQLSGNLPGSNDWPRMPDGSLTVIVSYSNMDEAERLKKSGRLLHRWTPSKHSTDYNGMASKSARQYASNGYEWNRSSYVAA